MSYFYAGLGFDPNYLEHHGVPGQKWGVRRGPPYPIEDKVLAKGTKLNTVSNYSMKDTHKFINRDRWRYTYNPNDPWDSKVYKGPFAVYASRRTNFGPVFEHQYETNRDLKMPTKKERVDAFVETYQRLRRVSSKELKQVRDQFLRFSDGLSDAAKKVDLKKLKTPEDYKAAYEIFNHAMESMHRFKMTSAYAKLMSSRFDAMVDDNNQGIYNEAHDPIIIFKAYETLTQLGDVRMLTGKEMTDNFDYVRKQLEKKGQKIKL